MKVRRQIQLELLRSAELNPAGGRARYRLGPYEVSLMTCEKVIWK